MGIFTKKKAITTLDREYAFVHTFLLLIAFFLSVFLIANIIAIFVLFWICYPLFGLFLLFLFITFLISLHMAFDDSYVKGLKNQ